MKRIFVSMLVVLLLTSVVLGETATEQANRLRWSMPTNVSAAPESYVRGTGTILYVDDSLATASDTADGIHGRSWELPYATINYALGKCTANNGDLILVSSKHTGAIIAATSLDADVAGVYIKGVGDPLTGRLPTLTVSTAATATIDISADDVVLDGFVITCGLEGATPITSLVTLNGDDSVIRNCWFNEGGAGADANGVTAITIGVADNDADHVTIENCGFYLPTAGENWDEAILFAKDQANVTIRNCMIYGDFQDAPINIPAGGNAQVNLTIAQTHCVNLQTGDHAIQINGTGSTGIIIDCVLETDGTYVDAGGLQIINTAMVTTGTDSDTGTGLDYWQERTVSVVATSQTDDLFDVAGGGILVKNFFGVVTTQIGAVGNVVKIISDSDAGWVDYELSTAVETNGDVAGTFYVFSNANPSVLTPLTPGAGGGGTTLGSQWIVGEGMLEQNATGSTTGAITWYMTYVPLVTGVTVTAQ